MIRFAPNDLIAISSGKALFHALILGRQALFGGSLCYVFHECSKKPREASYFLAERRPGYHAIVDWIIANRESRVTRVMKGFDTSLYKGPGLFKHTLTDLIRETDLDDGKAPLWKIVDDKFKEKKRTRRLTEAEAHLPNFSCLSGDYALKLARRKWVPEADERIERRRNGHTK